MTVEALLETAARRSPDKTALVCGKERWTYAELDLAANRLAHGLIAHGIEPGDRVAVVLDNCVEAIIGLFAVLKAGGVYMMINPAVKSDKLLYTLNNARAKAMIVTPRKLAVTESELVEATDLQSVVVSGAADGPETISGKAFLPWGRLMEQHADDTRPPEKRTSEHDLAGLAYTSGSTGRPKGVMLTHANIRAATESITTYLENTEEDVILSLLPVSFGYGLSQIYTAMHVGATVVLEKSLAYPQAVLNKMIEERVTGLPMVPTISAILLQMDLSEYELPDLRYFTNAGAAMPTKHIECLRDLFPRVDIYPMYGQTECTRVTYLPPDQVAIRPTSVGRGMPNEEVWLINGRGRRVASGEVGQLVVRGAHVMKGYWELPEETARALRDGPTLGQKVLYTGDLFRMDEEGYLYFVSRMDDIIKCRGEKVSPREVEDVLYSHADVAEAVVFGVPDPILGEAVKAVVVLKTDARLTEKELLRHCASRLEETMVPKVVEFRQALAKTASGKIDKRELQEALS